MMRNQRERYVHSNDFFYPRRFWGDEYRHDDVTEDTTRYTMRTSTGFGGTRRR